MVEKKKSKEMMSNSLFPTKQQKTEDRKSDRERNKRMYSYCGSVNNRVNIRLRTASEKCTHIEI